MLHQVLMLLVAVNPVITVITAAKIAKEPADSLVVISSIGKTETSQTGICQFERLSSLDLGRR